MKNNIFNYPDIELLLCISVALIISCVRNGQEESCVPYSLPDRFSIDVADEKAIVISNQKQFSEIFGNDTEELDNIDFKKYCLLYTQGKSPYSIVEIHKDWSFLDSTFKLEIIIDNNSLVCEYRSWSVAYLIQKGNVKDIALDVKYTGSLNN